VPFLAAALVAAALFPPALGAQALVPAGSINAAAANGPWLVLAPDDPAVRKFATAIRDRFFKGAGIATALPDDKDLAGRTLIVFATPADPFVQRYGARLPFRYADGAVDVDGRRFTGAHLRVIAAVRNPADASRAALLYTAAHLPDLVDINGVFHGPTEWVVADGRQPLASGAFLAGATLAPEALRADLEQLVASIGEVHPSAVLGLPADVAAAAATAQQAIDGPKSRGEGARILASVLLALHDAHSSLALPRSGETLAMPFVWLDEGLIVTADAGELRRGDRIVRFAGCEPGALEARLATVVPAENAHWRRQQAPALLADLGALALLGLAERAPVPARAERGGAEIDVAVAAGPLPRAPRRDDWVRFEIDKEHDVGIFTLDRCDVDATYRDTLAKFFRSVREQQIRRIAVDLRANSGGNSQVTDEFLRYLDLDGYQNFSGDVRWSPTALQQRHGDGAPRFEKAQPVHRDNDHVADPPPFRGELFVLTGPATFSSGNWFATVVHDNRLGRIVGEPTGNAPSSFGDILTLSLPKSGCSYTLSFKRWVRPDPQLDPAPTLVPDVLVPRTRKSVVDGSDPVLDWLRGH
jgi:hypothetical protein